MSLGLRTGVRIVVIRVSLKAYFMRRDTRRCGMYSFTVMRPSSTECQSQPGTVDGGRDELLPWQCTTRTSIECMRPPAVTLWLALYDT